MSVLSRFQIRSSHLVAACIAFAGAYVASPSNAYAVPILQLYIEGAAYDAGTETWVLSPVAPTQTFRLWAIGNVAGPGGAGAIYDAKLSVLYEASLAPVTISLTGAKAGGTGNYNNIFDAAVASNPTTDGIIRPGTELPKLGDGKNLPSHGEFTASKLWQEFKLGDFTAVTDSIADFGAVFPGVGSIFHGRGQINAYDVLVTSAFPVTLHFDLYNHTQSKNKAKYHKAPFSHDAGGGGGGTPPPDPGPTPVPEPGTLALLALGCCGLGGYGWRKRDKRSV